MFATPADLKAGMLLLANPALPDPNFQRTVILLVEHSELGSLGFVLSRPAGFTLSEITQSLGPVHLPVYSGGPVEPNTLHLLHGPVRGIRHSQEVARGIFWATDVVDQLAQVVAEEVTHRYIRLLLGYSGWSAGQLAQETELQSWIAAPASSDLWHLAPELLWQETLKRLGPSHAQLVNIPTNPRDN